MYMCVFVYIHTCTSVCRSKAYSNAYYGALTIVILKQIYASRESTKEVSVMILPMLCFHIDIRA